MEDTGEDKFAEWEDATSVTSLGGVAKFFRESEECKIVAALRGVEKFTGE